MVCWFHPCVFSLHTTQNSLKLQLLILRVEGFYTHELTFINSLCVHILEIGSTPSNHTIGMPLMSCTSLTLLPLITLLKIIHNK